MRLVKTVCFLLFFLTVVLFSACDRRHDIGTISGRAVQHMDRGNQYVFEGNLESAAEEFREALKCEPKWTEAHDNLDYCLRRLDPKLWFKNHPADMDAWMMAFKQMIESNSFDEAQHHVDQLPDKYDKSGFYEVLQAKRTKVLR